MMDDMQWYNWVTLGIALAAFLLGIDNIRIERNRRQELEAYWAREAERRDAERRRGAA